MKILGIDLGSRSVKIAVFENGIFVSSNQVDTHKFYRDFCVNLNGKIDIDMPSLGVSGIDKIVSTGYGRNNANVKGGEIINELKAHTYGAIWQTGCESFTLLDIGGQDSKVISVSNKKMVDFVLNDKCAASCGRYLENMANILGLKVQEIEECYQEPVELSSTCAVFGESELIGRISEGYSIERLAAGVNYSLFKRIKPLMERFKNDSIVLSGGVALNTALRHFISQELNYDNIIVPTNPQLNGAIGCCVFGMEALSR